MVLVTDTSVYNSSISPLPHNSYERLNNLEERRYNHSSRLQEPAVSLPCNHFDRKPRAYQHALPTDFGPHYETVLLPSQNEERNFTILH